MTRRAREKMQEQERPGLTKCDRMSQISIVKDASRAHPVYIMNEQPAQSIPSDNYVEKSLILTAYWYDRNFYCLVIFAMLNRIPLSQDLHIRVNVAPNRILILLKFSRCETSPLVCLAQCQVMMEWIKEIKRSRDRNQRGSINYFIS